MVATVLSCVTGCRACLARSAVGVVCRSWEAECQYLLGWLFSCSCACAMWGGQRHSAATRTNPFSSQSLVVHSECFGDQVSLPGGTRRCVRIGIKYAADRCLFSSERRLNQRAERRGGVGWGQFGRNIVRNRNTQAPSLGWCAMTQFFFWGGGPRLVVLDQSSSGCGSRGYLPLLSLDVYLRQ